MAELVTGAGSAPAPASGAAPSAAPGPVTAAFIGGFAPAHLEAPAAPEIPEVKPEPEPAKPEDKGPGLAALIKQDRESRKAREAEAARAKDLESKYSEAQAEIERLRRDNDFESDPVAYAKARGWDKEKQALMGQMLLYDLVPDKAPPDLRLRLFESKQAREKREAQEAQERSQREAQQAAAQEQYANFVTALDQAAGSFAPGSYPECESWFGEDHDVFTRSLVATAINMANVAQREGRVADLSPASIASTLEAEVARKMKARDERVQRRAKPATAPQTPAQPEGGAQPTESTKGTYGSGAPKPKAASDTERVQRAIAAAFGPPR